MVCAILISEGVRGPDGYSDTLWKRREQLPEEPEKKHRFPTNAFANVLWSRQIFLPSKVSHPSTEVVHHTAHVTFKWFRHLPC